MAQTGTTLPPQSEVPTAESTTAPAKPAATSADSELKSFILGEPTGDASIRPFSFQASDDDLADLKRRIRAVRWPERETVKDGTQGVQLELMQKLADYWATDYDWRRCEARLNALPNFVTEIDGLDIHFIHVRSKHENALPVIVTHGWPGSPIEQLKIIEPLTNPTAYGGSAADAFDVVIPSGAGYGFSGKPTAPGWNPARRGARHGDRPASHALDRDGRLARGSPLAPAVADPHVARRPGTGRGLRRRSPETSATCESF